MCNIQVMKWYFLKSLQIRNNMGYDFQTLELKFNAPMDKVAIITFNRPKSLNALNSQVIREFGAAIAEVEKQKDDLRALIIEGAGDRAFVAGADISEMVKLSPPEARNFLYTIQQVLNQLEALPLPVIAAMNGYALGGGLEIALACDIRIATEKTIVGQPEVALGLIPAGGGTQRLTRLIGVGQSKYLIMTGKRISAEEAFNRGIISKVVPDDKLDDEVKNILNDIMKLGPIAIAGAKRSIQAAFNENFAAGLEIELDEAIKCFMSKDLREGMNAFLEKREPNFQGK